MRRPHSERQTSHSSAEDARVASLHSGIDRHLRNVVVAGHHLTLEALDDLDKVIDQIMRLKPPGKDPANGVAEVSPHFGVVWPSALALCELLIERCHSLPGTTVLELGCGLALPSLIARKLGASKVVATDRHALVPHFLRRNAELNNLSEIDYHQLDWRLLDQAHVLHGKPFDLILGSDLLYEPWQPGYLSHVLASLLISSKSEAWIADPGRRYLDTFVTLAEAEGLSCELEAPKNIRHGRAEVAVHIVRIKRREGVDDGP